MVPVYEIFTNKFESPADVVACRASEVKALLSPLGLSWRIDQFQTMCQELVDKFNGSVPRTMSDLMSLTGVGHYVAAAVRVFAFGECEPLIDTNVLRILSRYLGVSLSDGARRRKATLEWVGHLVPEKQPKSFWWAMLDLGADICRAREPLHVECPLKDTCDEARSMNSEGHDPDVLYTAKTS